MDFKESLKNELYSYFPHHPDEILSEFIGMMRTGAVIKKQRNELFILFSHRNPSLIKKCVTQKKAIFSDSHHTLTIQERNGLQKGVFYTLEFPVTLDILDILGFHNEDIFSRYLLKTLAPHFLRGVFEARGYLSNPFLGYHLEIQLNSEKIAAMIFQFLIHQQFHFHSRTIKGEINLYSKHSQTIADFIQYLGAHQSYLELEKIMVEKSTINDLTRWVNYETANLEKIVRSSTRQRKKISSLNLDILPFHLREVAQLRLEHPCASLREIGDFCSPPLSKSEIHRRLKEIEKIADQKGVYRKNDIS